MVRRCYGSTTVPRKPVVPMAAPSMAKSRSCSITYLQARVTASSCQRYAVLPCRVQILSCWPNSPHSRRRRVAMDFRVPTAFPGSSPQLPTTTWTWRPPTVLARSSQPRTTQTSSSANLTTSRARCVKKTAEPWSLRIFRRNTNSGESSRQCFFRPGSSSLTDEPRGSPCSHAPWVVNVSKYAFGFRTPIRISTPTQCLHRAAQPIYRDFDPQRRNLSSLPPLPGACAHYTPPAPPWSATTYGHMPGRSATYTPHDGCVVPNDGAAMTGGAGGGVGWSATDPPPPWSATTYGHMPGRSATTQRPM